MEHIITLTLQDVTKSFGGMNLFAPLNCRVMSGQCLVITGDNGSGKTTLLKIIARLLRPSTGYVQLSAGSVILKDTEQSLPYLGMVSPEIVMYDHLTGLENIVLLSQARGLVLTRDKMLQALISMGLEPHSGQYVKTYSTGMKQRLKFALLSAIDPPVWLIDEGLSNLDSQGRDLALALLEQSLARAHLLVLTTNEQAEAAYATQTISLS